MKLRGLLFTGVFTALILATFAGFSSITAGTPFIGSGEPAKIYNEKWAFAYYIVALLYVAIGIAYRETTRWFNTRGPEHV